MKLLGVSVVLLACMTLGIEARHRAGPWSGYRGATHQVQSQMEAEHLAYKAPPQPDGSASSSSSSSSSETLNDNDIYYYFALHDQNHDGFLDGHEIRNALTTFGPAQGSDRKSIDQIEREVDEALAQADTNNDGLVSWDEYLGSQLRG
ncbi:uncharacterized protein BJ171DRAFT_490844 [Polychytrium aggregatum]|uniref:uncharacterized protein n=1 Tax=Polychytrium aggregatum TaxID=110093 RepID=UPI0022FE12B0|nr:uncharacterized protein BJ171DRAFT_490844 [Polychytrium aggregatum]KAI9208268.1 hypothetical protein BJ171DRAFT_490844 [Polychytrium aggregatum]